MKITRKNLSDTKVKLTITLGKEELEPAREVALSKLAKDMKVEGFRKGKVPVSVAAKNVSPEALDQQTLDDALSKAVAEAFTEQDIRALERPQVDITKYVPGESAEFTAEAEMLPEVKLGDYKKLKLEKADVKIAASEVNEIIERMRANFAERKEVKRAAKNGDETVIDFIGKKDGVAFDGGTAKGYSLELGSNSFIPGFEEAIVGKKPGEEFDVPLSFPDDYHVDTLKGAEVVFTVTLNTVKEIALPEVDDVFAAKCGPFTSVDDLKKDIKRELTDRKTRESEDKLRDNLVDQLIAVSTIPIPEVLIADQSRSIEQDFQQNLAGQGMTLDMYLESKGIDKDKWLETEVKDSAKKRVQAGLVLAELSKVEKIEANDKELAARIDEYRQQYASRPEIVKQLESPEAQREIANQMITEKTVDKLVAINTKK